MRSATTRIAVFFRLAFGVALLAGGLPARGQPAALPAPPRAAAASPIPNTFGWQDELVDPFALVGIAPSLALDSSGYPHIAYYDFMLHSLKYAAWDGVAWTTDTVETGLGHIDKTDVILYPVRSAIAVYGGTAYIVYEKYDDATRRRYLRYAFGGPGGWTISTLSAPGYVTYDYAPALRLDKNHSLHVSYTQAVNYMLNGPHSIIYARLDVTGTAWVTQTVVTLDLPVGAGIVTSLALDTSNEPQIAYGGTDPADTSIVPVKLARWNASVWLSETVALSGTLPSLAVDSANNPHIAFVDSGDHSYYQLRYTRWTSPTWQSQSLAICACHTGPSLALDALDHPRIAADDIRMLFSQWDGAAWQTQHISESSVLTPTQPALALDAAGQAHISYFDDGYQDLHYVSWAPNWQTQTVAFTGDEAHLAVALHNRPYISYSTNPPPDFYHVQLANWTSGGYWHYGEVLPFPAADHFMRLEYAVNRQPLPIFSYTDLRDLAHPHLGFATWDGISARVFTTTVDSNSAGFYSSLAYDNQANPIIGYMDLNGGGHPLLKYAASPNYGGTWNIITDTAAPTLGINSGLRSLSIGGSPICCNSYIAYYETTSQALRLATWNGAQWKDELVDGGNGTPVGLFVSLAVDRTTGKPAMAYLDATPTHGTLKYAFWRGAWQTTVVDTVQSVSDLSLSLALASDQYPRIAYTARVDKSLRLAWSTAPTSTWTIETVATFAVDPTATFPPTRVSFQTQDRDRIAFSQPAAGVVYAFSSATLPYSLYFNPLQPCLDPAPPDASTLGGTLAYVRALAPSALAQVDDLTTLRALRDLFELSPAGGHYVDLYYQYAHETGALALANPSLLWDAYRTLENFIPGFQALAAGYGYTIVITQAMVDQANNIADRLVAAGSPALGAAINTERAKHNHLQDFVGKTFDQAAQLLGVASHAVYMPLVGH